MANESSIPEKNTGSKTHFEEKALIRNHIQNIGDVFGLKKITQICGLGDAEIKTGQSTEVGVLQFAKSEPLQSHQQT